MTKSLIYFCAIIFLFTSCQIGGQIQSDQPGQAVQKTVRASAATRTPKPTKSPTPTRTPAPTLPPTATPTLIPLPAGLVEAINKLAEKGSYNGALVGLSLGLQVGGRSPISAAAGFANQKEKIPASTDTIYPIGSISDQFTAAAILQLAEKNKLSLDDPLEKYFENTPLAAQTIQLKHLLSHSSGLPSAAKLDLDSGEFTDPTALAKAYLTAITELDSPPGEEISYRRENYFILRQIIAIVSEQFYLDFIKENLIDPAGLSHTGACVDLISVAGDNLAARYTSQAGQIKEIEPSENRPSIDGDPLCSTVEDLLKWQHTLGSGSLLGPAVFKTMTSPYRLNNGETARQAYGLIVGGLGQRQASYTASNTAGESSLIVYLPRLDSSLVLLSNTESKRQDYLLNLAVEIIQLAFPRNP